MYLFEMMNHGVYLVNLQLFQLAKYGRSFKHLRMCVRYNLRMTNSVNLDQSASEGLCCFIGPAGPNPWDNKY